MNEIPTDGDAASFKSLVPDEVKNVVSPIPAETHTGESFTTTNETAPALTPESPPTLGSAGYHMGYDAQGHRVLIVGNGT